MSLPNLQFEIDQKGSLFNFKLLIVLAHASIPSSVASKSKNTFPP